MASIAFIDTEIEPRTGKILDIGCNKSDGSTFRSNSTSDFVRFLNGTSFICGHNILRHDLKYLSVPFQKSGLDDVNYIDTLFLSPLLFPTNPYHSLLKDDKLQSEEMNNPLNDAIKARDLFNDEVAAFMQLDEPLKQLFYLLLHQQEEFGSFFKYVKYTCDEKDTGYFIRQVFKDEICEHANISKVVSEQPIELAYCLSLVNSFLRHQQVKSITPAWVLRNYPEVERILFLLRNKPCIAGCNYCSKALDARNGLKRLFNFDSFRSYAGEPLQEKAVTAALNNKSILAIFPTGGGKSLTFQVPALMCAENTNALTIVISPLQSLMKDQVDNLEKMGITSAVTINGLLDPIERANSFERIENGSASLLYLSPESLRSPTIERLVLGRKIARFVIDEAHCFSSWGQDFRVDYLFIADFIKSVKEKKNLQDDIPVSCFTATAKQKVIEDIRAYFKEKLELELEVFSSKATRTNLHYKVFEKGSDEEKYQAIRNLIEDKNCPTIIYVSRTKKANDITKKLIDDGFNARNFHGKLDVQEKIINQNAFVNGDAQVMVATSAFGMGVDKKNVGLVIHYDISDSLENYVQEAGRAGRDENIEADCYVMYNEDDLAKHFVLLNQTKLSIKEIQQVWKAIKNLGRKSSKFSNSALEIARTAGWDDNIAEIETRVKTAIAALEEAGYLRRGQNYPRIFASSILSKTAQEAIDKINLSTLLDQYQKEKAIRIIKKLFSSKSRKNNTGEDAESRVDYISDHLGIVRGEVIKIITLLREEKILADTKDLTALIIKSDTKNRTLSVVDTFAKIENFILSILSEEEREFNIKILNEQAEAIGCDGANVSRLKTILNFWAIKQWIKRRNVNYSQNHFAIVPLQPLRSIEEKLRKRQEIAKFIVEYLYTKTEHAIDESDAQSRGIQIGFSVHELKDAFENRLKLFSSAASIDDIEDSLFFLSKINALKIEGGFLVVYNRLTIERLEKDNKIRYKAEDYQKLSQFYENKVQQIHIVGEYAKKMVEDYKEALQFVDDYFQLNYQSFLNKYFKGSRQSEIKQNITPAKFKQLFGELSATQLKIIKDNESKYIAVAAGPGSGKTRVLVHKLASLLFMEDVKHEQLLMLTFSRAAATEFKKRLLKLTGNAAHYVDIKTFHSYCFDLQGRVGSLEKADDILSRTVAMIKAGEVETSRVTKTVLVIDEAQDMNQEEFSLVTSLMDQNEDMRVIMVGDDDQNIYEFRRADSKHLEQFIQQNTATTYELLENYRSKSNLVEISNQFVKTISHRLKHNPIVVNHSENGKVKIVRYSGSNLITPLIQDIASSELKGTTCVLTRTNEEAVKITGLLLSKKIHSKLIQSNDKFNLFNLAEVRFFISQLEFNNGVYVIHDELWQQAIQMLRKTYHTSPMLNICLNIIKQFEITNNKRKYKSDLEAFIRESKIEDFYDTDGETIFVSTIHKAKGREFDNVFLLLENFDLSTDQCKRQLYVAMTRAKSNLSIHINSDALNRLYAENVQWLEDKNIYPPPREISMHLTHKEIVLDYFLSRQEYITFMRSGDPLIIRDRFCLNSDGRAVVKFSSAFVDKIKVMASKNYVLKTARVNFVVLWKKNELEYEVKIILPEVYFEKQ